MEQVTIHLVGTAEEVRGALMVLAGEQLPISTEVLVKDVKLREGPYSATLCAREGCHNKLTAKQVKQGSKYCGVTCAGLARRGMVRAPAGVTIVAGEGVTKGSVMNEEDPSKLPVPS